MRSICHICITLLPEYSNLCRLNVGILSLPTIPPAYGRGHFLRRAAQLRLFVELLESGERISRGHSCARTDRSETDLKGPNGGNASHGRFALFRRRGVRSGVAAHRPIRAKHGVRSNRQVWARKTIVLHLSLWRLPGRRCDERASRSARRSAHHQNPS
jgi:hypothetical protein